MVVATKERGKTKDALTGVGNYQAFMEAFEEEVAKAGEKGQDLSLAMIDIDFFKRVNDEHGHIVGDEVIKMTADHLSKSVSGSGTVFRYGGEEFVIVFPGTEKERAFLLLEQVRNSFDKEHVFETENGKVKLKLTFSAGISSHPEDGGRLKDIIRKADSALYRAKASGRNKICLSREEKMVTKTSHYAQEQLERLSKLAKSEGVGEAVLLREALDDLLRKYDDQLAPH
jgi:diguanylate cyclase (GGDEF)-like protein